MADNWRNFSAQRGWSDVLRGILLMCAGTSLFPFMNAAVKLLAANYPVSQIVWARFTGHLIIMLVIFCRITAGHCCGRAVLPSSSVAQP
jgi:hypothetical protein